MDHKLSLAPQAPQALCGPQACTCPVCGQPNGCAVAQTRRFDVACWCREVRIDPTVLARIPPEKRGQACVCRACAVAG